MDVWRESKELSAGQVWGPVPVPPATGEPSWTWDINADLVRWSIRLEASYAFHKYGPVDVFIKTLFIEQLASKQLLIETFW